MADQTIEQTEDDANKTRTLGYQLLTALQQKNPKEALQLIKDGADLKLKNEVGWNCLHYASQFGYLDVVKLILDKNEKLIMIQDKDGQIPLHKAAAWGQIKIILLLVSRSTKKFPMDYNERYPLESAVMNTQKAALEMLLLFGSDSELQDWTWSTNPKTMTKSQKEIHELLTKHKKIASGFESQQILFDLCQGDASKTTLEMENIGVSIELQNSKSDFYVYCCKYPLEFTDVKTNEDETEQIFSDVYEVRTWDVEQKNIKLTVTVNNAIKKNMILKILSQMSRFAAVIHSEEIGNEDNMKTKVEISLQISKNGITRFALSTTEKKQVVQVSKEAVLVKPEAEPDAEIDIPKDTFESAGELALQIIDTSAANEDSINPSENTEEDKTVKEAKQKEEEILVTNVLDISMSNGQQPKKDIPVKLPINNPDPKAGFVVLSTSVTIPRSVDDWEIIPAETDASGKSAIFKISHFSFYAGASKKKVEEDMMEVCEVLRASVLKIRKIEFRVLTRPPEGYSAITSVVVLCGSRRKLENMQKKWRDYNLVSTSDLVEVPEGQEFKLKFCDNIVDKDGRRKIKLVFKGSGNDSFIKFQICPKDMEKPPKGQISILTKEIEIVENEKEEMEAGVFCMSPKIKKIIEKVKQQKQKTMAEFEVSAEFIKKPPTPEPEPIQTKLQDPAQGSGPDNEETPPEEEKEDIDMEKLIKTDECKIEVLRWKNLLHLRKELDDEEIDLLAMQLGFKMQRIIELTEHCNDRFLTILKAWRGKRPHRTQVEWFIDALKRMQKANLADEIEVKFKQDFNRY